MFLYLPLKLKTFYFIFNSENVSTIKNNTFNSKLINNSKSISKFYIFGFMFIFVTIKL